MDEIMSRERTKDTSSKVRWHDFRNKSAATPPQPPSEPPDPPPLPRDWRPAALVAVLGLSIVGTTAVAVRSFYAHTAGQKTTDLTYQTGHNEQSRRLLPEGTVALMGADSTLRVHYTPTVRVVHVLGGEVDFDVADDAARPFVASTFLADIEQGRKFRVLVDTAVTVTPHEGTVKIRLRGSTSDSGIIVPAGRPHRIWANRMVNSPAKGLTSRLDDSDS